MTWDRYKPMLIRLATENPGTKGKFKVAAGIVFRRHLIATGVNSYKTHPMMLNGDYREHQIYLHAEADAIRRALRLLTQEQLTKASLYVVRVKKSTSGAYVEAMAKPCAGCMGLINQYNLAEVRWTDEV